METCRLWVCRPHGGAFGCQLLHDSLADDQPHPGVYALGIECDGYQYHSSKVAPDRDWLREKVLRGRVRLWDVPTRHQIGNPLTGHTSWVSSVAFSPDGNTLASGSADGTVRAAGARR